MSDNKEVKLKTLKDLEFPQHITTENFIGLDNEGMHFNVPENEKVYIHSDLQNVAREWIQEMDKGYCMDHEEYHLNEWSDPYECEIGNEMAKHVLRTFFNLYEEDD